MLLVTLVPKDWHFNNDGMSVSSHTKQTQLRPKLLSTKGRPLNNIWDWRRCCVRSIRAHENIGIHMQGPTRSSVECTGLSQNSKNPLRASSFLTWVSIRVIPLISLVSTWLLLEFLLILQIIVVNNMRFGSFAPTLRNQALPKQNATRIERNHSPITK